MLKTRSVWSEPGTDDGVRILATRFRGGGLPTSRYHVWMPSLGPGEQLLRAAQAGEIDWKTFAKRDREELYQGAQREAERDADVPLRRGRHRVPSLFAKEGSAEGLGNQPRTDLGWRNVARV
jgi:uncharacterized protein YeaO (DUF488 family)